MTKYVKINGTKLADILNYANSTLNSNISGKDGNDVIFGGSGNDKINGNKGNDFISGGAGNDKLNGGDGNDVIIGGAGNDDIDGGKGNDTAVYQGRYQDYVLSFKQNGDHKGTVTDLVAGRDGTDTLKNVEFIQFSNAIYDVANDAFYVLNSAPVVSGPVTGNAIEDGATSTLNALANATDADHDPLSVVNVPAALPAGVTYNAATHSFTINPANGAYQYLAQGQTTTVTVTYAVTDGIATTPASAMWTIAGTNDAATISGTASGAVTEDATLTTGGMLTVADVDSGENHFQTPASLAGTYGAFTFNATTGVWGYTLANGAANVQALAGGAAVHDTLTVKSADGTATQVIDVTITGTNDAATISGTASGAVTEDATLTTGGMLTVADVDSGENHFQTPASLAGTYGAFTFNATTGVWGYTLANGAANVQALAGGAVVHDTLTVKSADGTATQVIDVSIHGTNDAAVLSSAAVDLNETNAALSTGGQLTISDVDSPSTFQAQSGTVGGHGTFAIDAAGTWSYTANSAFDNLNVGDTVSDTFQVLSADNTATAVTVSIHGTNDAAVLSSAAVDLNETNAPLSTGGQLTISDVDSPATFQAQSGTVGGHGTFAIDAAGTWSYTANSAFDNLNVGDTVSDTFQVLSADNTATAVTVSIHGTNDAAVLSSAAVDLDETNAPLTTGGQLTISDVDSPATFQAQSGTIGGHGTFAIDAAGTWSYTANSAFDNLNVGDSVSDTFQVLSADNTATAVTVSIHGTNDAAVLSSAAVDLNETNAALSTGGQLTISDVDSPATFQAQSGTVGGHGTFAIDAAGTWSYTANSAFDNLNVGDTVSDTFQVLSADNTATAVTVSIHGTNDAAVLSAAAVDLNETNAPLTTGGQLTISDVDSPATFQAQSGTIGGHGTFAIDAAGTWSYTANSAFDNLNVGDTVSDTFQVLSADNTATAVTVSIHGTNDAAVIGTPTVADVTEDSSPITLTATGSISISDVDQNQGSFQTTVISAAGNLGALSLAANGSYTYTVADSAVDYLNASDTKIDTFTVASLDGTTKDVSFAIHGTNDGPVAVTVVTPNGVDLHGLYGDIGGSNKNAPGATHDATHFDAINATTGHTIHLVGTGFTYDGVGNITGGTVNDIDILNTSDGSTLVTETGFVIDAVALNSAVQTFKSSSGSDPSQLNTIFNQYSYVAQGGSGNDTMLGFGGTDTFNGGGGNNTVDYSHGQLGITVSLANPALNTGNAAGDTYTNVTSIIGTNFDDTLIGDGNVNLLEGGLGADTLIGGGGAVDYASYGHAGSGVTASLLNPGANTGDAAGDTYSGINGLIGSSSNDILIGDNNDNFLRGNAGADHLIGNGGSDTADYNNAPSVNGQGIVVDFSNIAHNTGFAQGDSYTSMENIRGSNFNDILKGDAGANVLTGQGGGDRFIIATGGGADTIADFSHAQGDKIDLTQVTSVHSMGDFNAVQQGANTVINFGNGDSLTLSNVTASSLVESDFIINPSFATYQDWGKNIDPFAALAGSATAWVLPNRDGLTSTMFVGTGFTYDAVTGLPTGGAITSMNLIDNLDHTILQRMTGLTTTMADLGAYVNTIETLRSQISWSNVIPTNVEPFVFTPTEIKFYNTDGSITDVTGTGFVEAGGGPQGTVTDARQLAADGTTVLHDLPGLNVSLSLIADAFNTDTAGDNFYLLAGQGNNTSTGFYSQPDGTNFIYTNIDGTDGNDIFIGQSFIMNNPYPVGAVNYGFSPSAVQVDLSTGIVTGGSGNDTLTNISSVNGSDFNDTLIGNNDSNGLLGGNGDDYIFGSGGDDQLNGGFGVNTLDGGAGIDWAFYNIDEVAGVTVSLAISGPQNTGKGIDTLISIENLDGTQFDDVLTGNAGDNILWGENGNDRLDGGAGNDTLMGGQGADTIVYGTGYASDTVVDFRHNDGDKIDVTGLNGVYTLGQLLSHATQNGNDTVLNFGNGDTLTLQNVNKTDLVANDFVFGVDTAPVAANDPAVLTFDDEFNSFQTYSAATPTGWDTVGGPQWANLGRVNLYASGTEPFNNELQWYVDPNTAGGTQPNPFSASNGVLDITAAPAVPRIANYFDAFNYSSGIITSYESHQQLYGYFEMRAELPAGVGLLPAFWLLPADGSHAELDAMEVLGSDPTKLYTTVHSYSTGSLVSTGAVTSVANTSTGFHTYGVDWEPNTITWYFDGQQVFQTATPADLNKPMYMIANVAVGGSWPGAPDASTPFPASMAIDYIRTFQQAYTVNANHALSVAAAQGVLANDTDAEHNVLTAILVNGPQHAQSFTLNADGSFNYTSALGYVGADSFTYMASDGLLASNTASVDINIGAESAPVAVADSVLTNEDTPTVGLAAALLANDTDAEGDSLTITAVGSATHGTVALNGGNPIFTPDANFSGQGSFNYTISDGHGGTSSASVNVDVSPIADQPSLTVNGTTASGNENATITLPLMTALLGADTDGSESVQVRLSGYPAGATFSKGLSNGDGTWRITGSFNVPDLAVHPLTMTLPANYNGTFTLHVLADTLDQATLSTGVVTNNNIATSTATQDIAVTINAVTAAGAILLQSQSFFGGAGDQRGTDITYANGHLYMSYDGAESQQPSDSAVVLGFNAGPGGATQSFALNWGYGNFFGVAADASEIYGVGDSYSLTTDNVGGKEVKSLLVRFNANGTSGNNPAPAIGDTTHNFFGYTGVESFHDAVATNQGGLTFVYATGTGQPFSYAAYTVAKFDASGNLLAAATDPFATSPPGGSSGNGVAYSNGDVWVAGSTGWQNEGDVHGKATLFEYDSNLNFLGRFKDTHASLSGLDAAFNHVTALGGALYAVGQSSIGGALNTYNYVAAKYNADGSIAWTKDFGGSGDDVLTDVTTVNGRLFAVGYTTTGSVGGKDAVLIELDPNNGNLLSSQTFGGTQDDIANAITADGTHLYVTGESRSFAQGGNASGQNDAFLLTYSLDGVVSSFTTIDYAGAAYTVATGINNSGQIVGYASLGAFTLPLSAVGWQLSGGTMSTIAYPGAHISTANDINDFGVVAGQYEPVSSTPRYGFIESGGVFTQTLSVSPGISTTENAINEAGVTVGSSYSHGGQVYSGFMDVGGVITYFNAPGTPVGGQTYANGINNLNQITGTYTDNVGKSHGFLDVAGVFTTLDDPFGVNGTFATKINNAGQVVGWYNDASNKSHGFIETAGVFTTIDDPLGINGTVINGINDAGQVVGYYYDGANTSHGFVATLNNPVGAPTNDVLVANPQTGSTMTGGAGSDTFVFNIPPTTVSTITDFVHGQDILQINAAGFDHGLTTNATPTLFTGTLPVVFSAGTNGVFIFDNSDPAGGTLYYDLDGGSALNAVAVAKLQGVTSLQTSDFHVV
jgi:VCBS repeat-containing protein